jgi:ATP synthase protein I
VDTTPSPPPNPSKDPRLEIPEVLRTPVRKSQYDPVSGSKSNRYPAVDTSVMGRAWGIAFDFVITVLVGAGLGWGLDRWQGWSPVGLMVGLAVGFVAAMVRMIRQAQKIGKASMPKRHGEWRKVEEPDDTEGRQEKE